MKPRVQMLRALDWQVAAGASEAMGHEPVNRYEVRPIQTSIRPEPTPSPGDVPLPSAPHQGAAALAGIAGGAESRAIADAATTLDELRTAVEAFDGCPLKRTARNTVFADGTPGAPLMVIGEAPGADEDRQGLPFVGRAGKLLDRMLAAIGLSREDSAYISNILFWRPPGNRDPDSQEIATCLPFVERHIELAAPRVLVFVGNTAARTMMKTTQGITRTRGKWKDFQTPGMAERGETPIPAVATFHPAYLLRQPANKKASWQDLLAIRARLDAPDSKGRAT